MTPSLRLRHKPMGPGPEDSLESRYCELFRISYPPAARHFLSISSFATLLFLLKSVVSQPRVWPCLGCLEDHQMSPAWNAWRTITSTSPLKPWHWLTYLRKQDADNIGWVDPVNSPLSTPNWFPYLWRCIFLRALERFVDNNKGYIMELAIVY